MILFIDKCDEEQASTCLNGATCTLAMNVVGRDAVYFVTKCLCVIGYSGTHCEVEG